MESGMEVDILANDSTGVRLGEHDREWWRVENERDGQGRLWKGKAWRMQNDGDRVRWRWM
eukprot:10033589-Karenia_brevis.AAC.1